MPIDRPIAIDLFSGVGGLSLGFHQSGFEVVGAFEKEDRHVETYCENFGEDSAHAVDLARVTGCQLAEYSGVNIRDIDVVFGGPPCQGFSTGGRRNPRDPRNKMLLHFARLVEEIKPRVFVMENVKGLLSVIGRHRLDQFVGRMRDAGYNIQGPIRTLDSSEYAVPQKRHRVFVIGAKKGTKLPEYPQPLTESSSYRRPTTRDAIGDLLSIDQDQDLYQSDIYSGRLRKPSDYAARLRRKPGTRDPKHARRRNDADGLSGCLLTRHAPTIVRRFTKTAPGDQEPISRYFRLDPESQAPTIRAGTGYDYGRHTAPRPIHYSRPRCITAREAARLHGYPDWFQFHPTRWHSFRQIGNSVPVPLARAVGVEIIRVF